MCGCGLTIACTVTAVDGSFTMPRSASSGKSGRQSERDEGSTSKSSDARLPFEQSLSAREAFCVGLPSPNVEGVHSVRDRFERIMLPDNSGWGRKERQLQCQLRERLRIHA